MFIPPINLGGWKPSPATMSEWIYQIWKYLQENPIATQEQIKEFINDQIGNDIAEKLPEVLPEELDAYFEEHPIEFPVDSVNGKLGIVLLELADIVKSDSMLPVVSLANDEADQETLVESFEAGARICVIDEESVSVMLPTYAQDGSVSAITLLPMSTGGGEGGDFSPITLSIGSSGNKTLNSGGTVAFTLTEIGAAPSSLVGTVTGIETRVGGVEDDIDDITETLGTVQGNITDLQAVATPVYHVGDQVIFSAGVRFFGAPPAGSSPNTHGFTVQLPIKLGSDVTGFTLTNAGSVTIRPVNNTNSTIMDHALGAVSTNYYADGTIASAELGILNLIVHHPATSTGANMCAMLALPSSNQTIITFTGS